MRKYILVILVLFKVYVSFGQSQLEPNNYLPNIVPPSPEAFKFATYGNTPVGLFTGSPNLEIPLLTYKTKDLNIPFSLTYSSSGLKVDDVNSKVGMGWVLNEAGVISRIVRDKEDDLITDFPMNHLDFTTINRTNPIMNLYFNYFGESEGLDTERDLFMFNFQGNSGKFYFDVNNNIVKLDKSDLRIEVINGIGEPIFTFLITTGNGVKYYFQALEETMLRTSGNGHVEPSLSYTSWFLTKIVNTNNEEIYFDYGSSGSYYVQSESQQISKQSEYNCGLWAEDNSIIIGVTNSHTIRVIGKKIVSITSNIPSYGRVDFEYEDMIPSSGSVPDKVIKSIYIRDNISPSSNLIDKIDFSYLVTSNNRIFLNGFHHSDVTNNYAFEYISPHSFPPRLSKSQDHWGYYNGANNINLIPSTMDYGFNYSTYTFANREPVTNFAKIGLLNKVTYPTKGYTDIEYESNEYYGSRTIYPATVTQSLSVNSYEGEESAHTSSFTLNNLLDQTIRINASVIFTNPPCPNYLDTGHNSATYRVYNLTTNTYVELHRANGTVGGVGTSMGITDNMNSEECATTFGAIANNNYLITLTIIRECLSAGLNFTYYPTGVTTIDTNIITGGLRVKSTKDFSLNTPNPLIKRYFYSRKNELNVSSGQKGQDPYYINFGYHTAVNPVGNGADCTIKDVVLSSSSVSSLFDTGSNNIYYRYVVVSDDDSFTNGYQENEFIVNRDYRENIYLGDTDMRNVPWSNFGWDNGKLISTKIYANKNNSFYLKKEVKNYYSKDSNSPYTMNFAIFNPVMGTFANNSQDACGCTATNVNEGYPVVYCSTFHFHLKNSSGYCIASGANNVNDTVWHPCHNRTVGEIIAIPSIRHMDIMMYKYITYFSYLSSTVTSDYFFDSNDVQSGVVSSTINYNYNLTHLHMSSQDTQNSKGEQLFTKYYYPQDSEMSTEPFRNNLVSKNIVAVPLNIQTFNGTDKISELKTLYNDWGNSLILPQTVQASKGSNSLENRVSFTAYDSFGNLLELHQENGMPISYLWGYNHSKPIAKIENATNAQIMSALGVSNLNLVNEAHLVSIDNLRTNASFVNAMITTFTYSPLIGLTSVTDPKGDKVTYIYDSFGRLSEVKDKDNNILSTNEYHFKN